MERILGLDLGVASIGWGLIEYNGKDEGKIIASGVRIFDQNLQRDNEAQKGESKNQQRTMHRGMRRQRDRRRRRKRALYYVLKAHGMAPDKQNTQAWEAWIGLNPYELRAKGLDKQLSLKEFGRALYHLNQHRGYKSNRKVGKDKDDGVVASGISKVWDEMTRQNARTLGEFLYMIQDNHLSPILPFNDAEYEFKHRIRNKYTHRSMYKQEFDLLWGKQKEFYPELLTDELRRKLDEEIIFKQRPLKSQEHLIGYCSLEEGEKRIPKADLLFQEFRILKTVNNLELTDENGRPMVLTNEYKNLIKQALTTKHQVSFKELKKKLQCNSNAKFNLETSDDGKLKGHTTNKALAATKAFGKAWYSLDRAFQEQVVEALIHEENPERVKQLALTEWGRNEEQAEYLANLQLEKGYAGFSKKAITRLMPHILDGKRENEAIKEVYKDEERKPKAEVLYLPLLNQNDYRNPVVFGAMVELRKVVNAIIREYGLPDIIRVELARDLKNSKKIRDEIAKRNRDQEKRNKEAIEALQKAPFNIQQPSRDDIIRYNLWKECKETCPYTGKQISAQALANGEFQIEHILPFSRTLDDSFANKTLCEADFNRKKGNRTPWECVEGGLLDEDTLLQRIRVLPWKKRRKFIQKNIDTDEFIARQLNDTRYMSREASKYLQQLGTEEWPVKVEVTKGQSTSLLRHLWGLNAVLNHNGEDIKNRDDHRHHAVDALVIALTSRSILKRLSDENKHITSPEWMEEDEAAINRQQQLKARATRRITMREPWPGFWDEAREAINAIVVSHRVSRKISGAFHEETFYGPTLESGSNKKHIKYLVVRKKVHALGEEEIGWNKKTHSFEQKDKVFIRDERIRQIVQSKIWEKYQETGNMNLAIKALENDPPLLPHKDGKGVTPIRKVRVLMEKDLSKMVEFRDQGKEPTRYALYGNNHHIAIYETTDKKGKKKTVGEVIPTMEAARRVRDGEPIVMREHPEYDRFLYSLSINEMVRDKDGAIYKVQKISSAGQITFRLHNIALKGQSDPGVLRKNPGVIDVQKIRVTPIGKIFPAND